MSTVPVVDVLPSADWATTPDATSVILPDPVETAALTMRSCPRPLALKTMTPAPVAVTGCWTLRLPLVVTTVIDRPAPAVVMPIACARLAAPVAVTATVPIVRGPALLKLRLEAPAHPG